MTAVFSGPKMPAENRAGRAERLADLKPPLVFAVVAAPLFVLYLLTATWTLPYHVDAMTNVLTAAELGTAGDVFLEDYMVIADNDYGASAPWVVPAQESAAAQYPPGAALLAAPLYSVWPTTDTVATIPSRGTAPSATVAIPPLAPAAIVAAATVAVAVGVLALTFRKLAEGGVAVLAAYAFGLGTTAWAVAADALWQHGPAMMWIAIGGLLSEMRPLSAGLAYGAAIITRPHIALIAAGNGLLQSFRDRSVRPAALIGASSAVGLLALVIFNAKVFGSPSITGGYRSSFAENAASTDILDYLGNVALALGHAERGLLVYSPFLILLIPGIPSAWRVAPAWVRGSAVGGLLYLLLQLKANRYSGGSSFWGYRYPLEMLAAGAPLLLLSYREWVGRQSRLIHSTFVVAIGLSVVITAYGAVYG